MLLSRCRFFAAQAQRGTQWSRLMATATKTSHPHPHSAVIAAIAKSSASQSPAIRSTASTQNKEDKELAAALSQIYQESQDQGPEAEAEANHGTPFDNQPSVLQDILRRFQEEMTSKQSAAVSTRPSELSQTSVRAQQLGEKIREVLQDDLTNGKERILGGSVSKDLHETDFQIVQVHLDQHMRTATALWRLTNAHSTFVHHRLAKVSSGSRVQRSILRDVIDKALAKRVPQLRYLIGEKVNMKFVPQLIFKYTVDEEEEEEPEEAKTPLPQMSLPRMHRPSRDDQQMQSPPTTAQLMNKHRTHKLTKLEIRINAALKQQQDKEKGILDQDELSDLFERDTLSPAMQRLARSDPLQSLDQDSFKEAMQEAAEEQAMPKVRLETEAEMHANAAEDDGPMFPKRKPFRKARRDRPMHGRPTEPRQEEEHENNDGDSTQQERLRKQFLLRRSETKAH